jgi:nucleoside-diphosphate-sugar epimerase
VITSSVAAIYPASAASSDASEKVYGPDSRVRPLPVHPYGNLATAYRASKVLALNATENLLAEEKPRFSIVNIMPSYVIGANELVTDASKVALGSNGLVMGIILGQKFPDPRPCGVVHVQDVARIHIEALDEKKVPGNKDFILESGKIAFDDAFDIVKKNYPDKVVDGTLPLGGSITPIYISFDVNDTLQTFGPLQPYEEQVKSLVSHYLSLVAEKKA